MARRCSTRRADRAVHAVRAHLPRVTDALSALDAVEDAMPDDFDDGVLVLPLDHTGRGTLAFAFRGGWPDDLAPLVDVLLDAAGADRLASVVVALVHPADDWPEAWSDHLATDDLERWRVAVARLAAGGVATTAFLLLGARTWAAVRFDVPDDRRRGGARQ